MARRVLLAARSLPLGELPLRTALPSTGIVARRPSGPSPAAWIDALEGKTPETQDTVLAAGWRGRAGSVVVHCFGFGASEPWGVVKVAPGASGEADLLDRLGAGARAAGPRVPVRLARGSVAGRSVLAETVAPGRVAADVLIKDPGRVHDITEALVGWLARWNAATAQAQQGSARTLAGEILAAADSLMDLSCRRARRTGAGWRTPAPGFRIRTYPSWPPTMT